MAIEQRRYAVEVFAQAMVLHGQVVSALRLSDLLNENQAFLTLEHVKIVPFHSEAILGLEQHNRGLVNKTSIVLVTETQQEGPGSGTTQGGIHVQKEPHRILIYTDQAAINADIHLAPGADMDHFLVQTQNRFIPITNASVTPIMSGSDLASFRRDFMLVNRDHINYLGADSKPRPAEPVGSASGQEAEGGELIG